MAIMGHQIGKALIEALGLPPRTVGFTLRCYADEIVTVECEYYPENNPQHPLATVLAEYELVRRDVKPAPAHFDTWMRGRIDAAHEAMIRRHADLKFMDARLWITEKVRDAAKSAIKGAVKSAVDQFVREAELNTDRAR